MKFRHIKAPEEKATRAERLKLWKQKHPGKPWPYYRVSAETREKISLSHLGRKRGPMPLEVRIKIGTANGGENHPMFGKHHSIESRMLLSMASQGITNIEDWPGWAIKNYCAIWFDPVKKIRKRVRAFWNNTCVGCGTTRVNKNEKYRFLHVHHVGRNKNACCEGDLPDWLFVPLCTSCHGKTKGKNAESINAGYTELINNKHGGKSYYPLEEYDKLVAEGILKTEDYGSRDGK
jgi:hypothetical protein